MSMWTLAIVPLIVWAGVIVYLFMLDRKLAQAESREKEQDEL